VSRVYKGGRRRVGKRGLVVVPLPLLAEIGVEPGTDIVIERGPGKTLILRRAEATIDGPSAPEPKEEDILDVVDPSQRIAW